MSITIATWNLEWFQHPTETPKNFRKRIYPKKLDYIVDTIVNKLQLPDIIGFQEINGPTEMHEYMEKGIGPQRQAPKSLQDLAERLTAAAPYTFHYSNYRSRGKRVAVFIKKPIVKSKKDEVAIYDELGPESHLSYPWVECDSGMNKLKVFEYGEPKSWHESPGKFMRPPMCLRISIGDKNYQLFIVQLKSKKPRYDFENSYPNIEGSNRTRRFIPVDPCEESRGKMRSLVIRAREACQLRYMISDRLNKFPDDSVIVLGDLGDDTESITTQILEETEENNHPKILELTDQRLMLENLSHMLLPDKRFSYIVNGMKEQHDHVLIGKDLSNKIIPVNLHPEMSSDAATDDTKIYILNEDIHKKSLVPEGYEYVPDHAPIMINLDI